MADIERYDMLIDGDWVAASDGGTFDSVNPATGEIWSQVPEATAEDVDRAVQAAHRAFTTGPWASMTPTERGKCLRRLAELLADQSEELGRIESVDTGKMLKETKWQAKYIAEFFQFYAGCADKISGETLPIDKPDMFVFTKREPLGVVAAVVPWNSQLFLVAVISSKTARVWSSTEPVVIGAPSFMGICPVRNTKSPARIALESDRTRPPISRGPPITDFLLRIVFLAEHRSRLHG